MAGKKQVLGVLLFLTLLHFISLYLFTSGFFLTRSVLEQTNRCSQFPASSTSEEISGKEVCWSNPKFKKLVLVIIDALRFDFLVHHNSSHLEAWQNHLPIVEGLLKDHPNHSLLYRFIADPPTTTMQRLKGMTTGGMPTFIDAADNFDPSQTIKEDNIIAQFHENGFKTILMGDDTWLQLYPRYFHETYDYPSLIVKDIDTVDNGVIKHLFPTLQGPGSDWDIIIAHFLGVDHVGHTYGPSHPIMSSKLDQMNQVIKDTIDSLSDDTLFVLLGDHGMTPDGNHGGASDDEVTAGLFFYSKSKINHQSSPPPHQALSVAQIDIVPTISLLMGIPIPFGNIGKIIPALFHHSPESNTIESLRSLAYHLHINCCQIHQYLFAYQQKTFTLSSETLEQIHEKFQQANHKYFRLGPQSSVSEIQEVILLYDQYHQFILSMCQSLWTSFDTNLMEMGLLILILCILTNGIINARMSHSQTSGTWLPLSLLIVICGLFTRFLLDKTTSNTVVSICCIIAVLFGAFFSFSLRDILNSVELFSVINVFFVMRVATLLSNSFMEAEKSIFSFFLSSLCLLSILQLIPSYPEKQDQIRDMIMFMIMIRLASYATGGNHESYSLTSPDIINIELIVPLILLNSYGIAFHSNPFRRSVRTLGLNVVHSFIPLAAIYAFISMLDHTHWILPPLITFLQVMVVVLMVYMFIASFLFENPLRHHPFVSFNISMFCLFAHFTGQRLHWNGTIHSPDSISWIFRIAFPRIIFFFACLSLIHVVWKHRQQTSKMTSINLILAVLPTLILLTGQHAIYTFLIMLFFLFFLSQIEDEKIKLLMFLFSSQLFFYQTGHGPQFSSLQFQTGFIGTDVYRFYLGTVLMTINTFSSFIFFVFGIPFIFTPSSSSPSSKFSEPQEKSFIQQRNAQRMYQVILSCFLFNGLFTFTITLFNYFNRRHLMVWRIFAPKYIFDMCILFVFDILFLFVCNLI